MKKRLQQLVSAAKSWHTEMSAVVCTASQRVASTTACEGDWDGHAVPGYVERELRRYLECGILDYGFARARCPECGHALLVTFSCKGRAVCPSCNARRMVETAVEFHRRLPPHWGYSNGCSLGQL